MTNTPTTQKTSFFKGLPESIMVVYVSASMFLYGALKYLQFGDAPYGDQLVQDLTNMELMWAFYGRTQAFPIIIGLFEILGAGLILHRRTRILGCLLLTTMLANIIMQDIFYEVKAGALISAVFYQILILCILWINKEVVIRGIKEITSIQNKDSWKKKALHFCIGLAIVIMAKMVIPL